MIARLGIDMNEGPGGFVTTYAGFDILDAPPNLLQSSGPVTPCLRELWASFADQSKGIRRLESYKRAEEIIVMPQGAGSDRP